MSQTTPLKIAFMGSAGFSIPTLEAIIDSSHELAAVYCQRPKLAGRGHKEQKCTTHLWAEERGVPVYTPKTFRDEEAVQQFQQQNFDLAIVAAYGLLLPKSILEAPKMGCVNIHGSLLPRWRGAAPVHAAILAGDEISGVTLMQLDEGLDTGDMLYKIQCDVNPNYTGGELHDVIAELGKQATAHFLKDPSSDEFKPIKQPEEGVTYAGKVSREDAKIDWSLPAIDIVRQIRAYNPWPVSWCEDEQQSRLKIFAAEVMELDIQAEPGTILDDQLTIACGNDVLAIQSLQRPGKNIQSAQEFLRGYKLDKGQRLF